MQSLGGNIKNEPFDDPRTENATQVRRPKRKPSLTARDAIPQTKVKRESIDEPSAYPESRESLVNIDGGSKIVQNNNKSSTASRIKQKPTFITLEDDDDDIQIVNSRPVSHSQATTQPEFSAPASADPADPDRKKRLLKMRLEELRIERELMEME